MDVLELFTPQQIESVLRRTLLFPDDSVLKYNITQCKAMEDSTAYSVLEVQTEQGFEQQYVLVKVLANLADLEKLQEVPIYYPSLVRPVFVLQNEHQKDGGYMMAFNKQSLEDFVVPKRSNLEQLKAVLKGLVDYQASFLTSDNENVLLSSEYHVNDLKAYFNDANNVADTLESLQISVDKLLINTTLVVKSLWSSSIINNNVYVHKNCSSSIFLDVASKRMLPPAFDALLYIFSLSTESFRQRHFEELIVYYFDALKAALEHSKHRDDITRLYSERQVRVLLPIVKCEVLARSEDPKLRENVSNYLKFPLINQEDVYEVLRSCLSSTAYELVNYNLVPLVEKNGHLGEYFHLNIKVMHQNSEKLIQVFAKILITVTDLMRDIVESGLAKKEDFFYRIMYPLYVEHGLEHLLDFAPKCHLSRVGWLLVLEDLSKEGYISLKPNSILDYQGLLAVVRKLAKLHASSLILEEILSKKAGKEVRLINDYEEYFEDNLLVYDEANFMKPMYDNCIETLQYTAELVPVKLTNNMSPEEFKENLKELFMCMFQQTRDCCKLRNVLNHGDMYASNTLVSYEADLKIIKDVVLIDFQGLRYIPPAFELMFFIFSSSTKQTRDAFLNKLLEEYYLNVTMHFKEFNLDPDELFPKSSFEENVEFAKAASLTSAFNYGILIHVDPDFREEIMHNQEKMKYYLQEHRQEVVKLFWDNDDHYRNVLSGFIEDYVDLVKARAVNK